MSVLLKAFTACQPASQPARAQSMRVEEEEEEEEEEEGREPIN